MPDFTRRGLGRLLSAAFRRVSGLRINLLAAFDDPRSLTAAITTAYLEGRRVGYVYHGAALGAPSSIPAAVIDEARASGDTYTLRVLTLLEAFLTGREITVAQLGSAVDTVLRQGVWAGQDAQAQLLAEFASAEWKRWVRAWPRQQHRDHHDALEGVMIPSDAKFVLPGGRNAGRRVAGPRAWDDVPDAGEWINCGHALEFLTRATTADLESTVRAGRVIFTPG